MRAPPSDHEEQREETIAGSRATRHQASLHDSENTMHECPVQRLTRRRAQAARPPSSVSEVTTYVPLLSSRSRVTMRYLAASSRSFEKVV